MRLFAALVPPEQVLEAAESIAARAHRDIKQKGAWVTADRMHITLKFFGDEFRQDDCIRMTETAIARASAFTLRLVELGGFPASRLKRVLFLKPEENEELSGILQRLSDPMHPIDQPHLTIARFNQPVELPRVKFEPIEWNVDKVTLINSLQFGADHKYVVVREWPLP